VWTHSDRDVMEYRSELPDHSGLTPANFTPLAHFSVSSAMNFPNSAGFIGIGTLHSALMPAALMIGHHFSISAF
jgi:hypothetical protein